MHHREILISPVDLPLNDMLAFLMRIFCRGLQCQALPAVQANNRTNEIGIGAKARTIASSMLSD